MRAERAQIHAHTSAHAHNALGSCNYVSKRTALGGGFLRSRDLGDANLRHTHRNRILLIEYANHLSQQLAYMHVLTCTCF
jgi:hypothetical protein